MDKYMHVLNFKSVGLVLPVVMATICTSGIERTSCILAVLITK